MKSISKVAIVKCTSYQQSAVDEAVRQAVGLLGGLNSVLDGSGAVCSPDHPLLLKPNLLTKSDPEKACTTHPAVFGAVAGLLQAEGYIDLTYGDSPGNPVVKPEKVAEECGIKSVADELGIPFGKFHCGTEVEFPQGRIADSFVLCDEVLKCGGIINICKMKTHQLERITGAVKNTFGCVYGVNKAASHAKFATAETFAKMLADLNCMIRPVLHVMDGIIAMEGNGPQSGTPVPMNVILASTDPVALDSVFCHLVYLDPELVATNLYCREQGIGTYDNIEILTLDGNLTMQEAASLYGNKNFDVQRSKEFRGALNKVKFLAPFLEKKPTIIKEQCVGCGICVKACPVDGKAIRLEGDICKFEISDSADLTGENRGHKPASSIAKIREAELQDLVMETRKPEQHTSMNQSRKMKNLNGRRVAVYDYNKCIKCYCCQEMCPQEAIIVRKPLLARLADRCWG